MIAESTGCCFPEGPKLIAPFHPLPSPPVFNEAALHGHKLQGSKCICTHTQITSAIQYCPALLFQWNHNAHAVTDPGPHVHGKELPCSSPQHILGHSQACFSQILLLSRERLVFDAGGPALQAPSSGSGKVSLPCAHLAKWENNTLYYSTHKAHITNWL